MNIWQLVVRVQAVCVSCSCMPVRAIDGCGQLAGCLQMGANCIYLSGKPGHLLPMLLHMLHSSAMLVMYSTSKLICTFIEQQIIVMS